MSLGTPLNNVAGFSSSSHLISTLAAALLAATLLQLAHATTPVLPPAGISEAVPLPHKGGSLDAWAAKSTVDAAGLAAAYCVDMVADTSMNARCRQNVMTESSICSSECRGCDAHDRALHYEACMDSSLFKSPCANETRKRFWTEALREASSKVPAAWLKGVDCKKDKNLAEDVVFSSFWDVLCSNNASAACFPAPAAASLLHLTAQRSGNRYKRDAYRQWLRGRVLWAVGIPDDCKRINLLQRTTRIRKEPSHQLEKKEVMRPSGGDTNAVSRLLKHRM